ncbi:DNA polymerase IV [Nitrososphaera sp.]|uniref:DNA polymerase IV n=1 Tax=Nitrososphaera sp. TaxID=1971748 RepID=UPI00307D2375
MQLKYFAGCAGWRFLRGLYPDSLAPKEYLSYYSRIFDIVEVALPATYRFSLKHWAAETPPAFRFAVRLPPLEAVEGEGRLGAFLEGLAPVEEKVLAVVVRAPDIEFADGGRRWLEETLDACTYHGYSVVIDPVHQSWFSDLAYGIMRRRGTALMWSSGRQGPPQAAVTSDTIYLRLAGAATEGSNDNSGMWKAWVDKARQEAQDDRRVETTVIIADHPGIANAALAALGLPEKKYAGPLLTLKPVSAANLSQQGARKWWTGRAVACIDLNAFYPSCEELREPALRGAPHAVIMTDQPAGSITRGVVSSCSYAARRFGVKSAMPLSRALALCPDLILRPVDIPYYKQVSEKVMAVLAGFASVLEQASIDEAFVDCTDRLAAAPGAGPERYAADIKKAILERCGLSVSVGIAPTKSAAKIACDFVKPDGTTIVYPDQLQDFLAPLEVGRISGIGPKTQQELKRAMGVETIGQLAACDVQRLAALFGKNMGVWMWHVATGADDEPVQPRDDHVSVSTEHSLELHARSRDEVIAHLHGLVDELYSRIARKGYMFRTVGVKLVRSDFATESREVSFQGAKAGREAIASAIPVLADRFSYDGKPVRKVGLRVTNLVSPGGQKQTTLLDFG